MQLTRDQILDHFRDTGALLEGHFILSSGLHSPTYLQCALALQYPADAARFGRAIAERFVGRAGSPRAGGGVATVSADGVVGGDRVSGAGHFGSEIEAVASPAIGGLVIGYAVAEALNVRFLWTERQQGEMTLRRGFTLKPGERILVVEDVITTGGSTRECIAALEASGGKVIGAASVIDRSGGEADVGVARISLAELTVPAHDPNQCPLCAEGSEAIKPGSGR